MISIDPATFVITVPQADLVHVSGSLYELDVDWFRLQLKDWEDSEVGVVMSDTHRHNTTVTLSGVTYARSVEVLSPYTVTFEAVGPPYRVRCVGANHNISDVQNLNNVSLIIGNSAGLIEVATGAGPTAADVADAVWDEAAGAHVAAGSFGELQAALATLEAQQIALVRDMHRLLGLDAVYVVEHGETYIRVPADGSLINIKVTKTGTTARFERL